MFYHTVLINSPFCDRIINFEIRAINFVKENGRSCQCDRIDWCGCSPNNFRLEDFNSIKVKK